MLWKRLLNGIYLAEDLVMEEGFARCWRIEGFVR